VRQKKIIPGVAMSPKKVPQVPPPRVNRAPGPLQVPPKKVPQVPPPRPPCRGISSRCAI
jgi:hypothetical protein